MTGLMWFTDPGHGWLRVPLDQLGGYQPTEYSYRDKRFAYLEEDVDASEWATMTGRIEEAQRAPYQGTDENSPVRYKARF